MTTTNDWFKKNRLKSINSLNLWSTNPRLNPEKKHLHLIDYAEDLISDPGERNSFRQLIKSIATNGFQTIDPIIVWKNNNKYYVAEGNRRVLALKLLSNPEKAPQNIRVFIEKMSNKIKTQDFSKIRVYIAPSFKEIQWYINQRNSTSTSQKAWSRIQQLRWIYNLYKIYKEDLNQIIAISSMEKSNIEYYVRIMKIRNLIEEPNIKKLFNDKDYDKAISHRFPITILERFFNFKEVKDNWGIEYIGTNVILNNNKDSFFNAYAALIKKIVKKEINTRTNSQNVANILNNLPIVKRTNNEQPYYLDSYNKIAKQTYNSDSPNKMAEQTYDSKLPNKIDEQTYDSSSPNKIDEQTYDSSSPNKMAEQINDSKLPKNIVKQEKEQTREKTKINNPGRKKIILDIYQLETKNTKLHGLFNELKKLPLTYPYSISSNMRVFLDLSIQDYINNNNLKNKLETIYKCHLRDIVLTKRLTYIKENILKNETKKIAEKLLNNSNEFSISVLNDYIHTNDTHYIQKDFFTRFWDFMFPLFQFLLDIKEN